jgi:CheY-like chemotaxis protein/HPt (histidine-containing phosphotransfer) domain-containing protein
MPRRSRLLVLEDDVLIRRFISMALADLPVDIVNAGSILQAKERLAGGDVDLLISDLMLPDGHATDLLRSLRDDPRHAGLRIVILSAGLTSAVRPRLAGLGVFRVLDKPVPYAELIACVEQALADRDAPVGVPAAVTSSLSVTQRERAIEDHFGGQASLFDEFLASCVAQLPSDVETGDRACENGDVQSLRRVAHNFKSVLQLIGDAHGHAMAGRLEHAVAEGEALASLMPAWQRLGQHVASLCARP